MTLSETFENLLYDGKCKTCNIHMMKDEGIRYKEGTKCYCKLLDNKNKYDEAKRLMDSISVRNYRLFGEHCCPRTYEVF